MVKDLDEFGAGHEFWVTAVSAQGAQDFGTTDVLRRCDVLQVVCRPVHDVAVEVVYFHRNSLPVGRVEDRARSYPRERNQFVAVGMVKIWHRRVFASASMPTVTVLSAQTGFDLTHHPALIGQLRIVNGVEPAIH